LGINLSSKLDLQQNTAFCTREEFGKYKTKSENAKEKAVNEIIG
jgi:hypothetical protein